MSHGWRMIVLAVIATAGLLRPAVARADLILTPPGGLTGTNGDINILPSSPNVSISYGADSQGAVYQMDGYVNVPGVTYDNAGDPSFGPSADLANGAPTGLNYTFAASQPTADQLLLSYQFTNISGAALPGFQFLQYTDPDIGTGYGEYATVNGASSLGLAGNPSSFEVSDAGTGTNFSNIANGMLTNNNDLNSPGAEGDVSFALGFSVGTLAAGQTVTIDILLSDDGSSLSPFSITEVAPMMNPDGDGLTISGYIVPEPSSLALLATGCVLGSVALARLRPGRGPSNNPSSSARCSSN